MKAVLRLIVTYFTGTAILRWTTTLGLVCGVASWSAVLYVPPLIGSQGMPSPLALWQETLITFVPIVGLLCFAFGASLLPALVTRLATSHYLYVLPHGRAKLLASVFGTIALIALFASMVIFVLFYALRVPLSLVFSRSFPVSLVTYSLVYSVLWLITRSRSAIGVVLGAVVIVATLILPLRYVGAPLTDTTGVWIAGGALWSAFAAGFLLAPRLKGVVGRARQAVAARTPSSSYGGGGEIDYLLGTARPWSLAFGQVLPILLAAYLLPGLSSGGGGTSPFPRPWLFFMTILSVLAGGMASLAATRSRSLWLRAHWTRAQLFARVEAAYWRHNSYTLGVLMIAVVAIGDRFVVPTQVLAFGVGLVILGTTISTYLGLMITTAITWTQTGLAVAAMGALLTTAFYAADPVTSAGKLVLFEAALVLMVVAFRQLARRRWRDLDWMRCRAEPGVRAAT